MQTQVIQCQTRGTTNLAAADNLVTLTRYHTSPESAGKVASVRHPDGTMQLYSHETNSSQIITTVLSG